jgi:hypothetical protein
VAFSAGRVVPILAIFSSTWRPRHTARSFPFLEVSRNGDDQSHRPSFPTVPPQIVLKLAAIGPSHSQDSTRHITLQQPHSTRCPAAETWLLPLLYDALEMHLSEVAPSQSPTGSHRIADPRRRRGTRSSHFRCPLHCPTGFTAENTLRILTLNNSFKTAQSPICSSDVCNAYSIL